MPSQDVRVHRHVTRLETERAEGLLHDRLARLLGPEQRRDLDEAHEQVLHPSGLGRDCCEDHVVGVLTEQLPALPALIEARAGLGEHVAEDPHDLVELLRAGHERRRDLHDRVASVVGAADQATLEEPLREEPSQEASHSSSENPSPVSLSRTSSRA